MRISQAVAQLLRPLSRTVQARTFDGGVEGLRCGRFSAGINTSVWSFRLGDAIIDTCSPNMEAHVVEHYAATACRRESTICNIFITHHHEDHSGNLAALQRLFPLARAHAPSGSLPRLFNGFHEEYYRRIVWGQFEPYREQRVPLPQPLAVVSPADALALRQSDCAYSARMPDGSKVTVVPVATPGHCSDHTVFWVPEKSWLFSADAFISESTKVARFDEHVTEVMRSLRGLIALSPSVIFCGHRGVIHDATLRLSMKLQWLERLQQRARALVRGGCSLEQARRQLLGHEEYLYYFSMGDFSQTHLLRGLLRDAEPGANPASQRVRSI